MHGKDMYLKRLYVPVFFMIIFYICNLVFIRDLKPSLSF